ncbi:MAG: cupredoxin family copper-binding protein [Methanothrix sp.]|nr:cupredoxin family copper-binding protein [Methanothrix sp.]
MKRYLSIVILIMLVSLSGAVSEKLEQQVGYNFGGVKLNQIVDPSGSKITVNIKDSSFQPSFLTVPVGATVEWYNQDGVQHTVTSDIQGLFDSGVIMPGKKYSKTFNDPGSYSYRCSYHPLMQGTITVSSSAIAAGTSGSDNAGSKGAASASWSEMPLSSSKQIVSAGLQSETQGATKGSGLQLQSQLQSNPIIDQSALKASGQASSQESVQASVQASSQVALQKFSQYYRSTSEAPEDQLTTPIKIDLAEVEPDMLYFGTTQKAVPYSQYQTYALSTGTNSIWISGSSSWTQYAMVPQGSMLSMITMSPAGGYGYLYEIYPDGSLDKNSYYLYPYNQIEFYADDIGEHQLFFNIAGQPSNVIVIDVVPYQAPAQPVYNLAAITISSTWLRGYNVYVDGSLQATEGMTGDPDGTVTINVLGNRYHNIAIDGNGLTFSDYKYFQAGYAYQLNV